MLRVECGNLKCWTDTVRIAGDNSWVNPVVILSLFGPRNAVRAAWARLCGGKGRARRYGNNLNVGDYQVALDETVKYITIQTPMSRQMLHIVMLHPMATHQASPFTTWFYQVGPEPEERYFARLNRVCPVPFKPEWQETLWKLGQEEKLITPLRGAGLPGYLVDASDKWGKLVKDGLLSGKLG